MTWADELKATVRDRTLAAATLAGVELRSQLRDDTPKDTGRTSRGWYVSPPVWNGSAVEFHIQHPQASDNPPDPEWLNSGTRPHVIVARRARVLAFPGRDGETVFRRQVFHPGFAGTGFIDRILSDANVSEVVSRALAVS